MKKIIILQIFVLILVINSKLTCAQPQQGVYMMFQLIDRETNQTISDMIYFRTKLGNEYSSQYGSLGRLFYLHSPLRQPTLNIDSIGFEIRTKRDETCDRNIFYLPADINTIDYYYTADYKIHLIKYELLSPEEAERRSFPLARDFVCGYPPMSMKMFLRNLIGR